MSPLLIHFMNDNSALFELLHASCTSISRPTGSGGKMGDRILEEEMNDLSRHRKAR